ncbi:hypothetical protein R3P38DRAFT_3324101 [Favolaschia claudopus]|uniref:Uncharacterized protein n=1 Tax=Favolaschia claudopus TaxID=2862362 RepID=A0AAW0AI36_9AGAR
MPDEPNMKFVPKAHRDKDLSRIYLQYHGVRELVERFRSQEDGRSPFLKFAVGCPDGSYKSETFTGMVKAIVLKQTRLEKGKCLRNMKYDTVFDQFCDLLASTSKRTYQTFQKHFGGRGLRSMRQLRAKLPSLHPGISAHNVARAAAGSLALSWDDTALEEAISVHAELKEVCLILGAASGTIRVEEKDDLDTLCEQAQLQKADKVPRGSTTKVEELASMHHQLATLLHEHDIHPVSFSSDGAEVERATQRIIADDAPSLLIPNSKPSCVVSLKVVIYFDGHPATMTQDSKHGLKTARNQLMTGARMLVIGFFLMCFSMLHALAEHVLGPPFWHDISNAKKQDDRAAARLFSAAALKFHSDNIPDQKGLSVYLFVLGELVDAWQNRSIPHLDRIKMVLRTQSYDIFLTLCDSLISLIIIYRQYFPTYPLLPWLHCEHLFGMLRQLKKDFNYTDVLNFERKLRAMMLGAFGNLSPDEQANQTSAGYHHTYFKADDLDMAELLRYSSDDEIAQASERALAEAEQLLSLLDIDADVVLKDYKFHQPVPRPPQNLTELLALYQPVSFKSSKDEDTFETCELALVSESLDLSLQM